jgi:hypothetical protein
MPMAKHQITLRWVMWKIAVLAVCSAILAYGFRQSEHCICGSPMADALTMIALILLGPPAFRLLAWAAR